jgi:hypothetical protein
MNAAAWIALAGAIIVVVTNVVVITRFVTKLEGQLSLFRAEIDGSLNVIREQHKHLVESTNDDKGRLQTEHHKFERRVDARLRDVERIVGKAKMFNASEGE